MKTQLKSPLFMILLVAILSFGNYAMAQNQCCKGKNHDETVCAEHCTEDAKAKAECTTAASNKEGTSGCTPSACRGAKTKFGEAKIITKLRTDLIALKADMEASKAPLFDAKSYDIHGIVGDNDDESLRILINAVQRVEKAFTDKTDYNASKFELPEGKAKQVQYLSQRIANLKTYL